MCVYDLYLVMASQMNEYASYNLKFYSTTMTLGELELLNYPSDPDGKELALSWSRSQSVSLLILLLKIKPWTRLALFARLFLQCINPTLCTSGRGPCRISTNFLLSLNLSARLPFYDAYFRV